MSVHFQQSPNQRDLISNNSNHGSIESSLKPKTIKSHNSHKNNLNNNNSQLPQQNVYEWQAVYIEGKFFLSDRQTIQRYFDIENQLKITKEKTHKLAQRHEQNPKTHSDPFDPIKTSERLFNLETIKVKDESQSQKQKHQDESLLNNMDTSSQNYSRLTFQMQSPESQTVQEPTVNRIDSISSIGKNQKIEYSINEKVEKGSKHRSLKPQENSKQKTISQKQNSQKKSQQNQSQYGYYLAANNQKVYSKKSDNQDVQNLESFMNDESEGQNEAKSSHQEELLSKNSANQVQALKGELLQAQNEIQLPIDQQTNRLKINSPFSSISSASRQKKQAQLEKITQQKQQEHKKSNSIIGDDSQNLQKSIQSLKQQKDSSDKSQAIKKTMPIQLPVQIQYNEKNKLSSLSLKFAKQTVQIPSIKSFRTYQNIKYSKMAKDIEEPKNNSFFSNNQHIILLDQSENDQSGLVQSGLSQSQSAEKKRQFKTTELLYQLSELSSRKKLGHQFEKKESGFLKLRNTLEASKKYQLPQIIQKTQRKSAAQLKAHSIDQKYKLTQKDSQFKSFAKADQANAQQDLSKSKSRLNGFIKNVRMPNICHLSALQLNNTTEKPQNIKSIEAQEDNKQKSKMSRSIRSRSSFMTRNYKASIPNEKQQAQVFGPKKTETQIQVNLSKNNEHKKSSNDIGKIKFIEECPLPSNAPENYQQKQAEMNEDEKRDSMIFAETKKDTAVSVNFDLDGKAHSLNPQLRSLRQNKQILLQKLQHLQKQDLESEINQIKQSIKQIQIQKLNKIAKTIDLSEIEESSESILGNQDEHYQIHLKSILQRVPEQIQKISKPTQIAEIKVPEQIILSNQEYRISPKMTPEELQQVAIRIYKLFGIEHDPNYRPPSLLTMLDKPEFNFRQKQKLLIKKFKNCVFFDIVGETNGKLGNKTIVWNFDSQQLNDPSHNQLKPIANFYIGGWSEPVANTDLLIAKKNQRQKVLGKGKKNGFGLQINQKFIYEGQYLNGKKHGEGKLYLIESRYRYEGQFIENHKSGHGKQFNPFKNEIYIGEFKHDKRHGKGYLKKINFKNRNDKSKKLDKKVSFPYFFNGTFVNGNKENGHEFFENGDKYKGEYLNEMFHGKGVFKWMNGAQYDGEFLKNFKQGFGKWSSGPDNRTGAQIFYIGEFKQSKKQGEGKYIYKNGAYYQGNFENDFKHGAGALFYEDEKNQSKVLRGYWKQGNIVANEKGQIYRMKMQKDEPELET